MNSVEHLLEKRFSLHTLDEQINIKTLIRPMPDLKKTRQFTRTFTKDTYTKYNNWLCGCNKRNTIFCFPCLLFGGELLWTKTGMTDLNHLNDRMKKHDLTVKHMNTTLNLATLGKTNVLSMLDSGYRRGIELHNEKVFNNR
ncbi:zinc finger MYM-type protein 1-like [Aphis craccivora]|uniref:Zinc finger MYM-type protein 1-like n=1 Tax=Aphis craccivora TaxID=307492 RepID=A0A6G0W1H0_APHCR|nr:zinc finger MYM-type protein 1-like [Aphis craccivora]